MRSSDEETGNYYFCASVMLLSHLLSHIKLFKGGFAHIKDQRKARRTRQIEKLEQNFSANETNWELLGLCGLN